MKLDIPKTWKPTSANINALPEPLRHYIHDLESGRDFSADSRTIAMLCLQIEELQNLLTDERRRHSRHSAASTPSSCQRRFSA